MGGLGDFLKGAAGGALGGSALGPFGAIGGGLLGGLLGGFGSDPNEDQRNQLQAYLSQVQGRQAPQLGPASQSALSGFRQNQSDLIKRLEAQSRGEGPSLATETLKAATDRNMAQQASIAASGRGNPALAAIQASNMSGRLGMQAGQDAAQARIAEQNMALSQLGSAINQGRTSDETNSQFNAQQQNFRDQANLQAKLQAMGMTDEQIRAIFGQMGGTTGQPTLGDQLLSGGAGMYALGATQKAQSAASAAGPQQGVNFGQYQRGADGSSGPITRPGQV